MNFLTLVFIFVVSSANALSDNEVLQQWENYKVQYGKSYRSPVEARKRLAVFRDNLEKIEEHNQLFERGESLHTEGVNQFTDWTEEEFMLYVNKGLIDSPENIVGSIYNETIDESSLKNYDWRKAGVVTDVKNQGQCGSCWSFSATGAIEGQLGRKGRLTSLSEQNLIDCSTSYGNNGCNGGSKTRAFEYVMSRGIERESDYPYTARDGSCLARSSKIVVKISDYKHVESGNENALLCAITHVGPISVSIDATSKLHRYRSGILRDDSCSSTSTNHGVLAVGYGSSNGINYYILKNSWGTSWGDSGYFMLEKHDNQCGIARSPAFPVL